MASMMSIVALTIDVILPALPVIATDLNVGNINDTQLIISLVFLGMAVGQIFYGPLSDTIGRNKTIYIGFVVFTAGSILSIVAVDFTSMLIGRLLQGLGMAAPRIICTAVIRDQYSGNAMARVTSFIMVIFILVPMVAPAFGQLILVFFDWRAIFTIVFIIGLITNIWFAIRQPDSLAVEDRIPFSLIGVIHAMGDVIRCRVSFGNTIIAGIISGAFLAYISTVQQIFQVQYELGHMFPVVFAALALALGIASFVNSRFVMRYGMQKLAWLALIALCAITLPFTLYCVSVDGHPPLVILMTYFSLALFTIGFLFGNLNAMAMEPLGKRAGVGAAVVGSLSTLISIPLGIIIGQAYQGTVTPLITGFLCCSALSIIISLWIKRDMRLIDS